MMTSVLAVVVGILLIERIWLWTERRPSTKRKPKHLIRKLRPARFFQKMYREDDSYKNRTDVPHSPASSA
ncbi:MAG TPA: hypothetical protein ACFCUC_00390 [Desulfobacterales bacterium]